MKRNRLIRSVAILLLTVGLLWLGASLIEKQYRFMDSAAIRRALRNQARSMEQKDIVGSIHPLTSDFVVVDADGGNTYIRDEALSYMAVFTNSKHIEASFTPQKIVYNKDEAIVQQRNHIVVVLNDKGPGRSQRIVRNERCRTYWRKVDGRWLEYKMTY